MDGSAFLAQGQYEAAISYYEQAIAASPADRRNYWYLGLARLLWGEEEEAQSIWLTVLVEAEPETEQDWVAELLQILLAEATRQLDAGDFAATTQICQQMLELDADRAEAIALLGQAIAQQGDLDTAIAYWQQATNLNPNFAEVYQQQGEVFQKLGQMDAATLCYARVLELQPEQSITHHKLGLCLLQQQQFDAAIAHLTTATQLNPNGSQAHGDRGYALLQSSLAQSDLEAVVSAAIDCFKTAIQLQPEFVASYDRWRNCLVAHNQASPHINLNADFLNSLQLASDSAETHIQLGNVLTRTFQFDLAEPAYQQALNLQPNSPETYFKLGNVLVQKCSFDQALTAYQTAIRLRPDFADAYLPLSRILAKKGQINQAIAILKQTLELDENLVETYLCLGDIWSVVQDWSQAIASYQTYLELRPDSAQACCKLGTALAESGNGEGAIAYFQKAMQLNSDLSEAIAVLTDNFCQRGKLNRQAVASHGLQAVDTPTEFYESTQHWTTTADVEKADYHLLDQANLVHLCPPKTIDKTVHFSFRFGAAIELPETFVVTIPNGRFWLNPEQTSSAVITPDGYFLADLSPEFPVFSPGHPDSHPSKHSILTRKTLPPIQKPHGTVAVLSGLLNDFYFHWMFDVLPRIALLHRSGIQITEIDWFVICDRLPFQQETLQTLGIPTAKILGCDRGVHIQAAQLIMPSFPGSVAWMPRWTCDFLRHHFLDRDLVVPTEMLYISRDKTASRRVINEAEIIELLTQVGFKVVMLESLSVAEQATTLAKAKVVIAPHGGGLTNLVFCRPGTKVIELFSPNYVYPCYWLISNLLGLSYHYLLGETPLGFHMHQLLYSDPRLEDIYIDLNQLIKLMKFAQII
jgi:tetratricopeptide (TPR) repeat protein